MAEDRAKEEKVKRARAQEKAREAEALRRRREVLATLLRVLRGT